MVLRKKSTLFSHKSLFVFLFLSFYIGFIVYLKIIQGYFYNIYIYIYIYYLKILLARA